jgi:hypothetical protein
LTSHPNNQYTAYRFSQMEANIMTKLCQIIAVEKGIKSRVYSEITELHKASQKADLFNGFVKNYQRKDDEGEELPPERKRVQMVASEVLRTIARHQTELLMLRLEKIGPIVMPRLMSLLMENL